MAKTKKLKTKKKTKVQKSKIILKKTKGKGKPKLKAKKGNTGKRGGQKENKNAETWPEDKALKLGNALILWLQTKQSNIYYARFLHIENNYPANILEDLAKKFESFRELKKRMDAIQEIKLCEIGCIKFAAMPIFVLKNKHGYKDKIDHTTNDEPITKVNVTIIKKTMEEEDDGKN